MKKWIASLALGTSLAASTAGAQCVVVNEFRNEPAVTNDAVELVVAADNLDMRGFIIKDFSSSGNNDGGKAFTFSTNELWSSVRAGTIIVLRNNNLAADTSVGGSDYNLDIGLANATYFAAASGTFDISTDEIIMIKTNGSATAGIAGSIHALAGSTTAGGGTNFSAIAAPKLKVSSGSTASGNSVEAQNSTGALADFSGTDALGSRSTGSIGTWNNTNNQAFIESLRVGGGGGTTTNIQLTASSATIGEAGGAYTVTVYKTLSEGNVSGQVSLGGSATLGSDYTMSATNFTMNGATTSATFVVSIIDDSDIESDETVTLTITNVSGGTISTPSVFTLTIVDNDTPPVADEGIVSYRFTASPHLAPTAVSSGITASSVSLTSGTIETNITTGTYFPNPPYIEETGGWTASSRSTAKAFKFTITPDSGYSITITAITFRAYATSAGPSAFGFTIGSELASYEMDAPSAALVVVSQTVSGVQNITDPLLIQIQGWTNSSRATTGSGVFRLDDVVVLGTVSSSSPGGTPPTLAAIGNIFVLTNSPVQFAVTATPTDGDTVTLSVSNAPVGSTFGSTNEIGTFAWANPAPAGVYTMMFYAVDKDGVDSKSVTLTVTNTPAPPQSFNLWINELHYDNAGGDTNEGFEVAGPAGTDLAGFSLVLYNGSVSPIGGVYSNIALSGLIADQSNGYGAVWFGFDTPNQVLNGPDGVALVYNGSQVIQFLSYEGAFTATNGPASGMTAQNIGVAESSTTPGNWSLQLCGTGTSYVDFAWSTNMPNSRGILNPCEIIPSVVNSQDTDSDGLPDTWELQYFGSATGADPYGDDDGDGMLNIEEFIAGTIPVPAGGGATSYFKAATFTFTNNAVSYQSVTGRLYRLWSITNLLASHWAQVGGPQAGDGSAQQIPDSSGTTASVYRITVEMASP